MGLVAIAPSSLGGQARSSSSLPRVPVAHSPVLPRATETPAAPHGHAPPSQREHAPPSAPTAAPARDTDEELSRDDLPALDHLICGAISRPDADRHRVARADLLGGTVDGASLDAVVSRGAAAALPLGWAPDDLVELPSRRPITARECARRGLQCLRSSAAEALGAMLRAMRDDGVPGAIRSTFRSDDAQCSVFRDWAYDDGRGFCRAATGSALPGHSQHQLGTTADLLTARWVRSGRGLSPDFGCSPGGRWIAAHAPRFGFVLPYALPPSARRDDSDCTPRHAGIDPTTGYAYEPWHVRFVGRDRAEAFLAAQQAEGGELSLDQWLRRRAGRPDDGDLPVCDGCACGACSTRNHPSRPGPCPRSEALRVRADGSPWPSPEVPVLRSARARRGPPGYVTVEAIVSVPEGTVTQTPAIRRAPFRFDGESVRGARQRVRDLPLAYRLAVAWDEATARREPPHEPWSVGLAHGTAAARFNGAALYLPAPAGLRTISVEVPDHGSGPRVLRVALTLGGELGTPIRVPLGE